MTGIPNRGAAGSVLDAVNTGLVRVEGPAIWIPGAPYDNVQAYPGPSAVTGDLTITVRWTFLNSTTLYQFLVNKVPEVSGWGLQINAGVRISLGNGTTAYAVASSVDLAAAGLVLGQTYWIKAFLDADNGAGGYAGSFWWAPDQEDVPTSWTVLGAPSVTGVGGPIVPSTAGGTIYLGNYDLASAASRQGGIRRVIVNDVFDFDAATDLPNPDALAFQCKTGQTVTVNRHTSGPVTTIVPDGTVVYVNPDDAVLGNELALSNDILEIAGDEDAVVAWCGQWGNPTAGYPLPIAMAGTIGIQQFFRSPSSQAVATRFVMENPGGSGGPTFNLPKDDEMVSFVHWLDRATGLQHLVALGQTGIIFSGSHNSGTSGGLLGTVGMAVLRSTPGSVSSFMFDRGVGIAPTIAEAEVIARRLLVSALREAQNVTGTVPPVNPVYGDRWRADNGHIAFYDGSEWTAVTPTTGVNVAVLLGNATLWLDAAGSNVGEQYARNRGSGGEALNARYGSTASTDTNDPMFLPHDGEAYGFFPSSTSYCQVPAPAWSTIVAGNVIEWKAKAFIPKGSNAELIGTTTSALCSMYIGGTPNHQLYFSVTRAAGPTGHFVSFPTLVTVGRVMHYKVTYNVATGASEGFESVDGVNWTSLGAGGATPGGALLTPSGACYVGWCGQGIAPTDLSLYSASVISNGVTYVDVDFERDGATAASSSFTAGVGGTCTVMRPTTGRQSAIVTRPIWLLGTDDYLTIPDDALLDFALADSFTVAAVYRRWSNNHDARVLAKGQAATSNSYAMLYNGTLNGNVGTSQVFVVGSTGNQNVLSSVIPAGQATVQVLLRNGTVPSTNLIIDNTAGTPATGAQTGTIANAFDFIIGADSGASTGALPADLELLAVAVWRRALTTAEITALNGYY